MNLLMTGGVQRPDQHTHDRISPHEPDGSERQRHHGPPVPPTSQGSVHGWILFVCNVNKHYEIIPQW